MQYAKRMVGRRMYGGTSTYLPLKVNQAGVIPVIFASSLLYLPQLITQLQGNSTGPVRRFFDNYVVDQSSSVHILLYFGLIIFFTYFYVSITFNPEERADDMKQLRRLHPRHPPGPPDRGVPVLRALPDHPARVDLPRARGRAAEPVPVASRSRGRTRTSRSAAPRC